MVHSKGGDHTSSQLWKVLGSCAYGGEPLAGGRGMATYGYISNAVWPRLGDLLASWTIRTIHEGQAYCSPALADCGSAVIGRIRDLGTRIWNPAYPWCYVATAHAFSSLSRFPRSGEPIFSPLLISHKVLRDPDAPYFRVAQHHHWTSSLSPASWRSRGAQRQSAIVGCL